jgi:hypothetical protein
MRYPPVMRTFQTGYFLEKVSCLLLRRALFPHKNGLVTLAPKIIGSKPHDLVVNHWASRLASLRWKPGSTYINFNETEMIEFIEHVLTF